jgi:hypothetical protein
MVTLEQAEALVSNAHEPWLLGDYMIAEVRENKAYFGIVSGARQAIVDDDSDFVVDGQWPDFVNKETGSLERPVGVEWIIDALEYLESMPVVRDYVKDSTA